MANANKKKHYVEKKHKVTNVKEYVKGFVASVGGKDEALVKAKLLLDLAKKSAVVDTSTVNFWQNVVGHIGKY